MPPRERASPHRNPARRDATAGFRLLGKESRGGCLSRNGGIHPPRFEKLVQIGASIQHAPGKLDVGRSLTSHSPLRHNASSGKYRECRVVRSIEFVIFKHGISPPFRCSGRRRAQRKGAPPDCTAPQSGLARRGAGELTTICVVSSYGGFVSILWFSFSRSARQPRPPACRS